jgi:hypothetical protein
MRPYKVSDLFAFANVLTAVAKNGGGIGNILKAGGGDDKASPEERGIALISYVLTECLSSANKELQTWLAGMCDMTVDEFMAQPATKVLELIDDIANSKDSKDFFSQASALFKKMNGSGTSTKKKLTQS